MNKDINYAKEYHEGTKHSEISIQLSRHYLDWNNKPLPFKVYSTLPSISLPKDFPQPTEAALACIGNTQTTRDKTVVLEIRNLAEILFFAAGITRVLKLDYGTYYMRAASATGALYPIELYVICQDIPGLKAGVYHFSPGDFTLTELRSGDYRANLAEAAGDNDNILHSPVTLAFTSIAWRNAWKYQSRSYRHWFWDSGVIAANFLATCYSMELSAQLIMSFVDDLVNRLLRIDDKQEAAIVLAPLTNNSSIASVPLVKQTEDLSIPKTVPLSREQVDYPGIWKLHKASYLYTKEEVKKWITAAATHFKLTPTKNAAQKEVLSLKPLEFETSPINEASLGETILLRGSSRKFFRQSISFTQLSNILYYSTRGVQLDFLEGKSHDDNSKSTIDIYFIANDVEGLDVGAYFFDRYNNSLGLLKSTVSRDVSGYLCLGQSLFSDASVVFFLMTDLNKILDTFGNRGYRASQFEAGVIAGKIYLAAYAQKIGASGSTFFDDAVSEFFSPHAADKSTMIVVGVGVPGYKSRPGKILAGQLTRTEITQ
ncbi:MAG TPA: SagB/ThcOx family dehydrogenase [Candidatus Eisenbacteria bacterium]|nr:SagB/ThcOx family dehydrogenase [Candidatus Eisenbacteria bacterium]